MKILGKIVKYSARCSFWVLLFLALIQPFGIDTMQEQRLFFILSETALAFVSIILSTGVAYLVTGRLKEDCVQLSSFARNLCLSNAINIPLLGAFLLTFNSWFDTGSMWSHWFYGGHFNWYALGIMSLYVGCVSVFLVMVEYFMFRTDTLRRELEEVKAINVMLEQQQERLEREEEKQMADQVDSEEESAEELITIEGQGQGAMLTVHPKMLIYVESMANYADICYISDNEIRHKTLRVTLKQIRERLEGVSSIVQCHRAFLVNINFVVAMTNNKSSYQLQLFGMDKAIPVSRANTEMIKDSLTIRA